MNWWFWTFFNRWFESIASILDWSAMRDERIGKRQNRQKHFSLSSFPPLLTVSWAVESLWLVQSGNCGSGFQWWELIQMWEWESRWKILDFVQIVPHCPPSQALPKGILMHFASTCLYHSIVDIHILCNGERRPASRLRLLDRQIENTCPWESIGHYCL